MSLHHSQTQIPPEKQHPFPKVMESVLKWVDQGTPDRLFLRDITFEDLERVLDRLHNIGRKPRYDWDLETHTAVLRMPSILHEIPGEWLNDRIKEVVGPKITNKSVCGTPSLATSSAANIPVGPSTGKGGNSVAPDQSFHLMQINADGRKVRVQGAPRMIIETSASEARCHIIDKIFRYLYDTNYGVHAVVICDMQNVPSLADGHGRPFKVEIAVWVRDECGLLASKKQLLDKCYGGDKHAGYQANTPVPAVNEVRDGDNGSNLDSQKSDRDDATYKPPFDPQARKYCRPNPEDPQREQWIYRRSPTWIPVYDETVAGQEEPQSELILDVYDILRPCTQFPGHHITDRTISIPLDDLRDRLETEVWMIRNPPDSRPLPLPQPQSPSPVEQSDRPTKKRRVL
ncbi:hypothetical protein RSOL_515400, partial [Rhizoctonia solani AG-3 Rhs1AP]